MRNPFAVAIGKIRGMSKAQRGLAAMGVIGMGLILLHGAHQPYSRKIVPPALTPPQGYLSTEPRPDAIQENDGLIDENELKKLQADTRATREGLAAQLGRNMAAPTASGGPPFGAQGELMAHTAELAVATKEFARSRSSLEEILKRHRGYAARLRMLGQKSGSLLSATLRVPATELNGTVSELKGLGDVEREEQAADEITQQHADLEARLMNARNTLRRLQELLQKQTYPDGNVRELQRQIANASAEVMRLEAERQAEEHRVIFANVFFTMREEMAATPSETLGGQLRGAAAAGLEDAMASLSTLLVFVIGRGPVVLLWCVILWVPARLVWRKWGAASTQTTATAQG